MREQMEKHRSIPACNSCHRMIDPPGLALENFDATGAWRIKDRGVPVDVSGELYDGTPLAGPKDLREALLNRQTSFVRTFTENLMAYALGRRVEYYDMPSIRVIERAANENGQRMSSYILGVVTSPAFRMKSVAFEAETQAAARRIALSTKGAETWGSLLESTFNAGLSSAGMGATVALPFLEAMVPAHKAFGAPEADRTRLVCIEMVHGAAGSTKWGSTQHLWSPAAEGPRLRSRSDGPELSRAVSKISDGRKRHRSAKRGSFHPRGDRRRPLSLERRLSHPIPSQADRELGRLVRARRWTSSTPSASARTHPSRRCSFASRTSTRPADAPMATLASTRTRLAGGLRRSRSPMLRDPRLAFDMVFGAGGTAEERAARRRSSQSILDFVTGEVSELKGTLDAPDRRRVDRYLENIREIERRIQKVVERNMSGEMRELPQAPAGVPDSFDEHVKLNVRPPGARPPGGHDTRVLVQDGP